MTKAVDWSVLITQMPRVQKMQGDLQAHPEVLQDQLAKEVVEKQKQEQKEVVSTAQTDGQLQIRPDQEKDRYTGSQSQEEEEAKEQEADQEELVQEKDALEKQGRHIDLRV